MAKPLVVEIPHELGKDEARRRLVEGTDKIRSAVLKKGVSVETLDWAGDTLNFAVSMLGQKVDGQVDVHPEHVRLEVRLPLLLAMFAEKMRGMLSKEGTKLLTKK